MLTSNHRTGFGAATWAPSSGVVEDIATGLTGSTVFGSNNTFRLVILGGLFGHSFSQLQMEFQAGGGSPVNITACYIGQGAASGEIYDFAASPTPVTFAGSATKSIAAGTTVSTDVIAFSPDISRPIVLSYDVSGNSDPRSTTSTAFEFYQLGATPKASLIDVSGAGRNGDLRLVSRFITFG